MTKAEMQQEIDRLGKELELARQRANKAAAHRTKAVKQADELRNVLLATRESLESPDIDLDEIFEAMERVL